MRPILCSKDDYNYILTHLPEYWGSERTKLYHHPIYIYEFGDSAFVIKEENEVIGYLFGFLSQTENTAYIHLIGIKISHQKKGFGKVLYDRFILFAKQNGANYIKAVTTPQNNSSIQFHKSIGMHAVSIKDYSGIGNDRIVFEKSI